MPFRNKLIWLDSRMSAVLYMSVTFSSFPFFSFSQSLLNTETQITRAIYGISSWSKFFSHLLSRTLALTYTAQN